MSDTELNFARCFATTAGAAVLSHLRRITIERTFGVDATDEQLRWGAAQSALVHQIETLIKRGNAQ